MYLSKIIKLQLDKKCHTLLSILALFRMIDPYLVISKKCMVIPSFLFVFQ